MGLNRNISALKGTLPAKQGKQAMQELKARKTALLTWERVSFGLGGKYAPAYLWQIAEGKRPASRRLLRALGIVKPEKRTDIRIRMTASDAREIAEHDTIPLNVKNRIRYALWGVK